MTGGQHNRQPPSYQNIEGGSLNFNEVSPPSYEEAVNPNGKCVNTISILSYLLSFSILTIYTFLNFSKAPPPSYDSLFGRVREARKTSKGVIDFLKNILIILLGAGNIDAVLIVLFDIFVKFLNFSVGCTVILGITIIIPICMIVMGSIYLHECPQGEYIPVYLLVGGIFGVLKQLLHLSTRVRKREEEREVERLRQSPTQTLLNCFMLGWFIIGELLIIF